MRIAKAGDVQPATTSWRGSLEDALFEDKTVTWAQLHKSVVYGQHPLFHILHADWVICILHLNLRIVGSMFKELVVERIGWHVIKDHDQLDAIHQLLADAGVNMKKKKLEKKANTLKAAKEWKKLSFIGAETLTVLELFPAVVAEIYPVSARADRGVELEYQQCLDVHRKWCKVWDLLNKGVGPEERDHRANEVETAGVEYVKSWVEAHKRTQGLYVHLLVAHVPDMIRRHGCLVPYQAQGLEHMHSIRKRLGLRNSNRKKGSRTGQIMKQLIAMDSMRKHFYNTLDARDHDQRVKARASRAKRRVNAIVKRSRYVQL
jgi:hypothetical protein